MLKIDTNVIWRLSLYPAAVVREEYKLQQANILIFAEARLVVPRPAHYMIGFSPDKEVRLVIVTEDIKRYVVRGEEDVAFRLPREYAHLREHIPQMICSLRAQQAE